MHLLLAAKILHLLVIRVLHSLHLLLQFFTLIVVLFYLLYERSELRCKLFLFLSYLPKVNNSLFVLLINSNFILPDKSEVLLKFLSSRGKNLPDLMVA